MADDNKQHLSDDLSNLPAQAHELGKTAKNIQDGIKEAKAAKAAKDTAKAAGTAVKAAGTASQTAANVAAGSAAGPAGIAAGLIWSFKDVILKVVAVMGLIVMLLAIFVAKLPEILIKNLLGIGGSETQQELTIQSEYERISDIIDSEIALGHEAAFTQISDIISSKGYNLQLSMDNIKDHTEDGTGYDAGFVMSAYSVSKGNKETDEAELQEKLSAVRNEMFKVECTEKVERTVIPAIYYTYREVTVNEYISESEYIPRTYYTYSATKSTNQSKTIDAFRLVTVKEATIINGSPVGYIVRAYYEKTGTITVEPTVIETKYGVFTVYPFDNEVILNAFDVDENALYLDSDMTNGEVIADMTEALRYAVYGENKSDGGNVDVIYDGNFVSPLQFTDAYCSSEYGYRTINGVTKLHGGIDLCCFSGTLGKAVNSVADGKVISVKTVAQSGYGNSVIVDHGNGITSLYAHLDSFCVNAGDTVTKETIIGYAGNTYNASYGGYSTGPHLHLEIRKKGEKVNPRKYISLPSENGW